MEFHDTVRRRHMVRRFDPLPVPGHLIDRMLENAVRAPSAGFSQGWSFLVLDSPQDTGRYWSAATPTTVPRLTTWLDGMRTAPVLIVVLTSPQAYRDRYAEGDKRTGAWTVPYWHVDAGMAALLMLLTAVDEHLGACFFGVPPERTLALRAEFDIPEQYLPTGVVAVGYPADGPASGSSARRARRPWDEVVHRGRW